MSCGIFCLGGEVVFIHSKNVNKIGSSTLISDMENVMSVGSSARVKSQSWGKILALKIRCFVKNTVFVMILHSF